MVTPSFARRSVRAVEAAGQFCVQTPDGCQFFITFSDGVRQQGHLLRELSNSSLTGRVYVLREAGEFG